MEVSVQLQAPAALAREQSYWYKFEWCDLKRGCAPKISMRVNFKKIKSYLYTFEWCDLKKDVPQKFQCEVSLKKLWLFSVSRNIFPIYSTYVYIHEALKWLRYNTWDIVVRNFCITDHAIVTRLLAALSGVRFSTGTRNFSQLPNRPWSLQTFLFSVFYVPFPQFPSDKVVRI
jgi:hypothetical protein